MIFHSQRLYSPEIVEQGDGDQVTYQYILPPAEIVAANVTGIVAELRELPGWTVVPNTVTRATWDGTYASVTLGGLVFGRDYLLRIRWQQVDGDLETVGFQVRVTI